MFSFAKKKVYYQKGQITITDSGVLEKLRFHNLTETDLGVIKAWADVCRASMDVLVDKFYEHIQNNPKTKGILLKYTTVER
ncbi:MAG TPA: protoglobin domain-containing protein, partial [Pyrinomonadaceae bacterium]|nr:protoglobin domain-containing protein [Pyrinomonadaceae bacterium]